MKQCARCDFVYLQHVLPYTEFIRKHAWTKTIVAERQRRRRSEPLFDGLGQWVKAFRLKYLWYDKAPRLIHRYIGQGRLLDVGCGKGKVLRRLDHSFTPYGIEIDCQAAVIARSIAEPRGGQVYEQDALSALHNLEDEFFDGVVMRSYLEHENEPRLVLEQAKRVLKRGGRLIVKVPNYGSLNRRLRGRRWCGFRFPDHVNYFTPRTLTAAIHGARLTVVSFRVGHRLPTSDNMWLVAQSPLA